MKINRQTDISDSRVTFAVKKLVFSKGMVSVGMGWIGLIWVGMGWFGMVLLGMGWYGLVWDGIARNG